MSILSAHDVAIIGAGPAGCVTALAHARTGSSVVVLEANSSAATRLAGEWLHPGAIEILRSLGIDLVSENSFDSGRGFVVFPEDGSEPIRLDYEEGSRGWSGEHHELVGRLRREIVDHPHVTYLEPARVVGITGQDVSIRRPDAETMHIHASRIVGADGRTSRARAALGLDPSTTTLSRMAGLRLRDVELPFEGYGHIFLGGPGPVLAYRIREDQVRLCLDVPSDWPTDEAALWDAYAPVLPAPLRPALNRALRSDRIAWAANQVRPRTDYGRPGLCLIGDAAGFRHPLTAAGITLGMTDAATLAASERHEEWTRSRRRDTRTAEMLGDVLYEIFAADSETTQAIRQGIYALWRDDATERRRTMRYIAGSPGQSVDFARTFARVTIPALGRLAGRALVSRDRKRAARVLDEIAARTRWLASGGRSEGSTGGASPRERNAPAQPKGSEPVPAGPTIEAAVARLTAYQGPLQEEAVARSPRETASLLESGRWEGEVAWCPMLAAQYVLFSRILGLELTEARRRGLIRHFERTQTEDGLWGLHRLSPPYLFVTTLVYVAARMLGVEENASLLARSSAFLREQDVRRIPSWGKFWLALAGLYDWRGVPPVVPELWSLPDRVPFHPANFYCHTRHIYLAMSVLYARKPTPPTTAFISQLRRELFIDDFDEIDWRAARRMLRPAELATPPSLPLRAFYELAAVFDRHAPDGLRKRSVAELEERIRWELDTTDHTSISPVSGLLNVLALSSGHRDDPEIKRAIEQLEQWTWHDDDGGTRIAGARSASWDTAFALQALAAAAPHCDAQESIALGRDFLRAQQIRSDGRGFAEAYRLDPDGGWCFADAWHGWPVSDCTAEAIDGLLATSEGPVDEDVHRRGLRFMLRTQNRNGGFGSYESKRSKVGLEWLNPAEMFGDSMTEHSYVECTGSCISAIRHATTRLPELRDEGTDLAVARAVAFLRHAQREDGAWQGVWAVHLVYGTLFGIRGLVAAGVPSSDPALRRARRWLVDRQRADGGWGESHIGCLDGEYLEHDESQVVQTAWALLALLEAQEPDWRCITRAAEFLMARQDVDGSWPREDPSGLFFRTALLDYALYRQIFPLWALSTYETRRRSRLS